MNWTLAEIETFLAVLDAGSISGAATRADLSKSVVSKRISDFEAALGTALFSRHAGRIAPTDAGLALAERLRPALADLVAATESAAWGLSGLRGRLAIAAPTSFGIRHLGPVIADFARAHPELEVALDYDDALTDLARSGFDIAIRIGRLHDSTLMARKLCDDLRVIVASPGYLEEHGPLDTPDALGRQVGIGYCNRRFAEMWELADTAGRPVPVPSAGRLSANNGEAIRDMAEAGLGLALLPLFIVHDALAGGRLVRVLPGLRPDPIPISAVWPPVKPVPRKIRLFLDHLAKSFGGTPSWHNPAP